MEDGFLRDTDTVPAVVAAAVFGSQAASLLSLTIQVPTDGALARF